MAGLVGHTAALVTDWIVASFISSRNSATSSGFQRVGLHMRGDWLNTWIASQPRSTPRRWASTRPPAVETCAPISIASFVAPRASCARSDDIVDVVSTRLRFAPSPTGAMHIGGARTALYNWLLARGSGGRFVLRIEDTDRERSTPENVDQILEALRWLELDWDDGPLSQWERRDAHSAAVQQLLADGHAYEDEGAVRFRVPEEGEITFQDAVLGDVTNPYSAIKDYVIQRSDGSPLYNLAVAVDDRDMGITHVGRGQDHVSNTPRQLMLLRALGAEPPVYAHIPLLHGPDGKKLSKRHGAASVQAVREDGYLPEAVRNYIALLGWGYDETTTLMTTDELVERFALERVSKNPAVFDEQKLRWMNGRYMRDLPLEDLHLRLQEFC